MRVNSYILASRKKKANPTPRKRRTAAKSSTKHTSKPAAKKSKTNVPQHEQPSQPGLSLKGLEEADESQSEEETVVEEETDGDEEEEEEPEARLRISVGLDNGTTFSGPFPCMCFRTN